MAGLDPAIHALRRSGQRRHRLIPAQIVIKYKPNFPSALPMLYVLFTLNGQNYALISLVVNETPQPIFLDKTLDNYALSRLMR
jgi:hypothetical protein